MHSSVTPEMCFVGFGTDRTKKRRKDAEANMNK